MISEFREYDDEDDDLGEELLPEEFIKAVLDNLKSSDVVNSHWRPQYLCCPFCAFNFRYLASLD